MSLTERQRKAVTARGSAAVTAGPGTGKTFLLVERYLHHVMSDGFSPLEIVATTFTRKAVAELRRRIRASVRERLAGQPDLLAEVEAAPISTIDGLAGRICQDHPGEAGVPADFTTLDEQQAATWMAQNFDDALDVVDPEVVRHVPYPLLKDALDKFVRDPLAAREALAVGPEVWETYRQETRRRAKGAFFDDLDWAIERLESSQGPGGDVAEDNRGSFVVNLAELRSSDDPRRPLEILAAADMRGGSGKAWSNAGQDLKLIKGALSAIRDRAKRELKKGEMALEYGEGDRLLEGMLPHLRVAHEAVQEAMAGLRRRDRVFTFADVEAHALKALEYGHVRDHYAQRWKAVLVDEVQDLNPAQEQILQHVTQGAKLTLVGDGKQAIYSFRRADPDVFDRMQQTVERERGGSGVALERSFRTHRSLLEEMNRLSGFLGALHQTLRAERSQEPGDGPFLDALLLNSEAPYKEGRRRAEGRMIGRHLRRLVDEGALVHDRETGTLRPLQYGDIATLTRYKRYLPRLAESLEAEGVPAILTESDDLLEAREAKDGLAAVRFLADPLDSFALVALLRSPMFAISDAELQIFASGLGRNEPWWPQLKRATGVLGFPRTVLEALLSARREVLPSELLLRLDDLTGYSAVIANLPSSRRRLADWAGFLGLVRQLEADQHDVFAVRRALRRLIQAEAKLDRPALEVGNAVTLMNVHKAKGLEWPVVVLASLDDGYLKSRDAVMMHPSTGVGFKLKDDDAGLANPIAYTAALAARNATEGREALRLLYVALTRARDRLVLSASSFPGQSTECDFKQLEVSWETVAALPGDELPPELAVIAGAVPSKIRL